MSHTPGPWVVDGESGNDGEAEVIVAGDRTIAWTADTYSEDDDAEVITVEDRANARLIAAAPELLAMLRRGSDAVSALEADCDMAGLDCYPARHWWQDADRLIAKAEGRE